MAIGLTEEHEALRESVRGWVERHVPPEARRAAGDGDTTHGRRPAFWSGLAEQGLLGLHVREEHGGQGFGLLELAVVTEELGRTLVPGPFLPTVLASAVIGRATGGASRPDLGLADGSRTAAVGLEDGLAAESDGHGGLRVRGETGPVLGAPLADVLVLPAALAAPGPDAQVWFVADAHDLTVTPVDDLDLGRGSGRVRAEDLAVPADRVLTGLTGRQVRDIAAVLFGAEAAGIAAWCLAAAADYAKVREQFGRPIGQFQAVKHRCAEMLLETEQARAAIWDAARALDGAPEEETRLAAAVAGVVGPDAAVRCAYDCIQVLGGIGYTWEHDAHVYLRRALALRALLGRSEPWAARVAELAMAGVRRSLEVELPAGAEGLRDEIRGATRELAAMGNAERRRRLADDGWVLPHLPGPWGRSAGPVEQVLIQQEFRAAGVARPDLFIGAWAAPTLVRYGTPEQQERFLPPTLRGEITWCQLFSEPGAGSDLASLSMRAERVDGGWRLTGQKIWTSLAHVADWAICLARTDPDAPKHEGITYFLVDMKSPGVEVRRLTEITGDALFNEVFLDGVFVPDDCVVGEPGQGWRVARTTLANERVALSTDWSLAGVKELLDLVRSLGDRLPPDARERIGVLVCESQTFSLLGLRITLMQLSGTEPGPTSSVRKLLGMRHGQRVAEYGWSLLGPDGVLTSGPTAHWPRLLLAGRALSIGGGTTEIQLNIIAERILGLPRDPAPETAHVVAAGSPA
ncbi:MAG: acyl-CoA dehydrogenase [Streptosporangiales bacterium]|nr:acyl-CoA dehydrogenase [Streptosporangiales bacterium]